MSVALEDIRLAGTNPDAKGPLFDGLSLRIGDQGRVGILGGSKSGKSTLLRLICGTKPPDDGRIKRNGRVSWPIPLSSFLVGGHTLARNIRFIARVYGIDDETFPRRIVEMVELTDFLNTPFVKCPKLTRQRLGFALGVGLEFDLYLFDGSFTPVDKPFKEKAAAVSAARTAGRAVVVATSVPAEVEQNCESVYVLENGRATFFAEASQGVEHFKQLLGLEEKKKKGKGDAARRGDDEDEDQDETGLGDMDILAAAVADAVD